MSKELDKNSEVTDLNFEGENPHLAITHRSQGFSANERPQHLLFKSKAPRLTQEIVKSLKGKLGEQELTKMLKSNTRKLLADSLEEALKVSMEEDYVWVYVEDFSDDIVIFEFRSDTYAVAYKLVDDVTVEFEGEITQVQRRDMYVATETGEELVKAAEFAKLLNPEVKDSLVKEEIETNGEIEGAEPVDTPKVENKEDNMSDKGKAEEVVQMTPAEMQEMVKAAIEADRITQDELRKAAELETSTTELVKGFSFVEEGDVEELVKSLVAEGGEVLIKTLSAAKEKVESLQSELEKGAEAPEEDKKEEELEKGSEVKEATDKDRTAQLTEIVKAKLAAKNK